MLEYINRRMDVLFHLKSTASLEHQKRVWVNQLVAFDDFDEVVHILFDDTGLSTEPEKNVGLILRDTQEVDAIRALTRAIAHVLTTYGNHLSDAEYIQTSEWSTVLDTAQTAVTLFKRFEEIDKQEYEQWQHDTFNLDNKREQ